MNSFHSYKLDVLRMLLCACVLLCHFYPAGGSHPLAGHVGVLGFFVLSGYLLQKSFYRMESGFNVEKFFASRAEKLLPLYVCSFLMALLVPLLSPEGWRLPPVEQHIYSVFEYVWFYNLPAWYMGCLFVFLFMAPFMWWLHSKQGGLVLFFIMTLAFSSFLYWRHDGTSDVLMGMEGRMCPYPQVRLWQFLAGMLAARIAHDAAIFPPRLMRRLISISVFALLLVVSVWVSIRFGRGSDLPNCYWFDLGVVSLLAVLVVLWDDKSCPASPLIGRLVAWGASLTYGVYLFHVPLYRLFRGLWMEPAMEELPIALVVKAFSSLAAVLVSVLLTELLNRGCARYLWKR